MERDTAGYSTGLTLRSFCGFLGLQPSITALLCPSEHFIMSQNLIPGHS